MPRRALVLILLAFAACGASGGAPDPSPDPGAADVPDAVDAVDAPAPGDAPTDIDDLGAADPGPRDAATDGPAADAPPDGNESDVPGDPGDDGTVPYAFVPLVPTVPAPDPAVRLCAEAADPVGAPDKVFIDCPVEAGRFAPEPVAPADALLVMAYNLERGVHLDDQVAAIQAMDPRPDVILASELDRGCGRSDGRHVARDLAEALEMDWAFAVEFVELRTVDGDPPDYVAECEHGNAILSRYPLGNVRALRHATQAPWYFDPGTPGDQPRLGGRVAVLADVDAGNGIVHLASLHLESAVGDAERTAQAAEIAAATARLPHPVLVGGDLNAGLYFLDVQQGGTVDPTVAALTTAGFVDAHQGLPYEARVTAPGYAFVLDLILGRGLGFRDPTVGSATPWDTLSDHRPVWVTAAPAKGRPGRAASRVLGR
jgi:endonuclease/exonuclease/phosphatase family metal-dependent hydrolase